jgi:hypothetical protein
VVWKGKEKENEENGREERLRGEKEMERKERKEERREESLHLSETGSRSFNP